MIASTMSPSCAFRAFIALDRVQLTFFDNVEVGYYKNVIKGREGKGRLMRGRHDGSFLFSHVWGKYTLGWWVVLWIFHGPILHASHIIR